MMVESKFQKEKEYNVGSQYDQDDRGGLRLSNITGQQGMGHIPNN
jgi:hypothetical protein